MSVADSISAALKKFGRQMTLRRMTLNADNSISNTDVTVYGHSIGNTAAHLVDGINQGVTIIQISNAEIAAASWPGPPRQNDVVILDGRNTRVQSSEPKYLGAAVLVHEMTVKG